ncbi:MAG TPA: c-type cytochrome [Terriglobia bacterium]|nr:c-type cytochrome [Terriglobia bacterium]
MATGCQPQSAPPADGFPAAQEQARIERGKYLVTAVGCNDCHTPLKMGPNGPEPDMARMLSGHPEDFKLPPPPALPPDTWNWAGTGTLTAFAGPWGITYAANLTPDENTGLGIWDEAMFLKTIRNGRHMGDGRPLQPPMPWAWYRRMTDEDLKAIFAYLKSIRPIRNRVPDYQEPAAAH